MRYMHLPAGVPSWHGCFFLLVEGCGHYSSVLTVTICPQVLVRVFSTGVNHFEYKMQQGKCVSFWKFDAPKVRVTYIT